MHDLDPATREAVLRRALELLEAHARALGEGSIVPDGPVDVSSWDFDAPRPPLEVVEGAARALAHGVVHPDHPRYFGLFNSAPAALAVVADLLASAYNPQLATRGHAPWPVAVEDHVLGALGERFGYARAEARGAFTSGGGEANATALACALASAFPEIGARGLRALGGDPTLYVSAEGHATIARAARLAGLGGASVRVVPTDASLRMKVAALREAIGRDRASGALPFLVVATAGATSAGTIDPIAEIARVAEREGIWLHLDAAWGGLAALVPELRPALAGSERADSITFDPHKVMSAPMGTGAFLTRREGVLEQVFRDPTGYMPRDGSNDPYARSMMWSRRFIGLRVLLPLAAAGWEGYAASLRRQVALADRLRTALAERGWKVVNETPLPVVCFVDGGAVGATGRFLDAVARAVIASAGGWISVTRLSTGARALRACVNNHKTREGDVDRLVLALEAAREDARERCSS